jgi:hypothetical protein
VVRITVTVEALQALAATLALGSAGYEDALFVRLRLKSVVGLELQR